MVAIRYALPNATRTAGTTLKLMSGAGAVSVSSNASGISNLIVETNNSSNTISGVISGSGGLTKLGSGTAALIGANSYTGDTTLTAGTLGVHHNTALGTGLFGLANDTAGKVPAIAHAVRSAEEHFGETYDICVDLDATSPLRIPEDIIGAVELLESTDAKSVITGAEAHRSPYFNLVEEDANGFVAVSKKLPAEVLRRQDAPRSFDMNGSVYVWRREALVEGLNVFHDNTRLYEMPPSRSLDIDHELDFKIVEFLMKEAESKGN